MSSSLDKEIEDLKSRADSFMATISSMQRLAPGESVDLSRFLVDPKQKQGNQSPKQIMILKQPHKCDYNEGSPIKVRKIDKYASPGKSILKNSPNKQQSSQSPKTELEISFSSGSGFTPPKKAENAYSKKFNLDEPLTSSDDSCGEAEQNIDFTANLFEEKANKATKHATKSSIVSTRIHAPLVFSDSDSDDEVDIDKIRAKVQRRRRLQMEQKQKQKKEVLRIAAVETQTILNQDTQTDETSFTIEGKPHVDECETTHLKPLVTLEDIDAEYQAIFKKQSISLHQKKENEYMRGNVDAINQSNNITYSLGNPDNNQVKNDNYLMSSGDIQFDYDDSFSNRIKLDQLPVFVDSTIQFRDDLGDISGEEIKENGDDDESFDFKSIEQLLNDHNI